MIIPHFTTKISKNKKGSVINKYHYCLSLNQIEWLSLVFDISGHIFEGSSFGFFDKLFYKEKRNQSKGCINTV